VGRIALVVFFVSGLAVLIVSQPGFAQTQQASNSLVGAWRFSLAPSAGTPTEGLISFTSDGTVVENDLSEIAAQPTGTGSISPATAGQGIWQPSPVFGKFFVRFVSLAARPNATLRATRVITMTIGLNSSGNQFLGGYTVETRDASGRTVASGLGTVSGTEMTHPQLP
jgi:hypothetical protein